MMPAHIDTPEQVMACAIEGRLTKHALASLLGPEPRRGVLDACGVIEKSYTERNGGTGVATGVVEKANHHEAHLAKPRGDTGTGTVGAWWNPPIE